MEVVERTDIMSHQTSERALKHLIDLGESPAQAIIRVLGFLRVELRAETAGSYLAESGRLIPRPGVLPADRSSCAASTLPLRNIALRAAFSGRIEQQVTGSARELALPLNTGEIVTAVIVLRRTQVTELSESESALFELAAGPLRRPLQEA